MKSERANQITVYRPNARHDLGVLHTWVVMACNVVNSRELIWQLFKRDFFAVYKKSFIGITWLFLMPVFAIVSWVVLKRANILNPGRLQGGIPYTVYVLVGSSMWGLFLSLFMSASNTLNAGKSLVMQVHYSHEALLFQQAAQSVASFSIGFVMNIAVLIVFGIVPTWRIAFLPLVLVPMFLLASGVGLMLSMFGVVAVDLSKFVIRGMTLMMMFTPIVYGTKSLEDIKPDETWQTLLYYVNRWNPLTYLVCSARDIVLYGRLYDNSGFVICSVGALALFLLSWRLFFVSEDKIIERMV